MGQKWACKRLFYIWLCTATPDFRAFEIRGKCWLQTLLLVFVTEDLFLKNWIFPPQGVHFYTEFILDPSSKEKTIITLSAWEFSKDVLVMQNKVLKKGFWDSQVGDPLPVTPMSFQIYPHHVTKARLFAYKVVIWLKMKITTWRIWISNKGEEALPPSHPEPRLWV